MKIINNIAVPAAGTYVSDALKLPGAARNLLASGKFAYGSGGTTVDVYIQTSFDGGDTWIDVINFHFATASAVKVYNLSGGTAKTTAITPTDGALANDTVVDGILGNLFRTKTVVVGTYAGSQIAVALATDQAA